MPSRWAYSFSSGVSGIAPDCTPARLLQTPSERVQRRNRRLYLPLAEISAKPTTRPAVLRIAVAKTAHDKFGQVAGGPTATPAAPAIKLVTVL